MEQFVDQLVRKLVLDIVANLVASPSDGGTPVLTGWARANWVPQIGSPSGRVVGTPETVSTGTQQAALARIASTYRVSQGTVTIGNNVPYIVRLNAGSSQQAPAMFVQAGIAKAIRSLSL